MTTNRRVLDPDLMLALCRKFSGYDGAVRQLAEDGLKNPRTGKPYTKHAVRCAAMKAAGYAEWRREREKERSDTAREFRRIARKRVAEK